ncbi:hypothetical protein O4A46_24650 [Cupriavidus gilardii]|uniref:hypothetical protein n=1 Tax=Cupriavidus gilardii TaxID=82541 RepID=UPI00352DF662
MPNVSKRSGITVRHTKDGMKIHATGAAAHALLRELAGLPADPTENSKAALAAAAVSQGDQETDHEA